METSTAKNLSTEYSPLPTTREERGRQIAKRGGIKTIGSRFAVPSQSGGASSYIVDLIDERCSCPDWDLHQRGFHCKHIEAVYYWVAWGSEVNAEGNTVETLTVKKVTRPSQPRDWSAYNQAQVNEGLYVEKMLRALCDGIQQPPRKPGRGRKPIPLKDQAFASIMKVFSTKSQRRMQSDLADSVEKGNLEKVANFNIISDFLGNEASTEILMSLVEESAKPLAVIENGQFAIDSTGFSTVNFERWFAVKHGGVRSTHPWAKLHLVCGTVTHAITAVKVSPEGDCPQLPELVAQTMKNFNVRELSADKAYGSKSNFEALDRFGVAAFIPFKVTATMDPKCETWSRHLAEFLFNQDKFLSHYHRRSNVESVMFMLKSKLGASVRSKTPVAQMNELLAKCVAHNLTCVVQAIFSAGLAPKFWQDAQPVKAAAPRPHLTLVP